jgi:hypothetical protein
MEQYADLLRLCQLMHEKNEIQGRRHHARKRALRLKAAMTHKAHKGKWQRDFNRLELTITHLEKRTEDWAKSDLSNAIIQRQSMLSRKDGYYSGSSKRMLAMSHSDLKIMWYEAHVADNQAKLDIARFTKANRIEMQAILKRNKWVVEMDNTNGHYVGVRTPGAWESPANTVVYHHGNTLQHQHLVEGKTRIGELALQAHATQDLENALLA